MRIAAPPRPLLKEWLLSILGWGAVGLMEGVPMIATHQLSWADVLLLSIHDWLPWAILTPLIWRLVKRAPLERRNWFRTVPAYLVVGIVAVSLCHLWKQLTGPHLHPGLRFSWAPSGQEAGAPAGSPGAHFTPTSQPLSAPSQAAWEMPHAERVLGFLHFTCFELPSYLLILSASHAVLFYRRQKERETGLAQTRLEILQMRLQPHFLFNTLNTIAGLVHEEPDKADAMLIALSELLRLTLTNSTAFILPLSREMEFLERYVAIMKTRFDDRLKFETFIDPDTTKALVPTLLLQPLVENAVQHGLELDSKEGIVTVQARREGMMLQVSVHDNGVGIPQETLSREGVGLGHTRARLMELYGNQASLQVYNDDGFTVAIRLPYKLAE